MELGVQLHNQYLASYGLEIAWKLSKKFYFTGAVGLDVQGVQLHTQYLASYGLEIAWKL